MAESSIFDLPEFEPYADRWRKRTGELERRKKYYNGTVYRAVRQQLGWLGPRLYRGIKPLYLPLARAVDVDAGIIPGGWTLPEEEPRARAWQQAINTVFDWSDWDVDGVLFIHFGAMYGVSSLKVSDLRKAKRVMVKPVNPACLLLVGTRQYDTTPEMSIWVEERHNDKGEEFEYAEVITPESIRTFADGKSYSFDGRPEEYKNDLGFVPFTEADHIKTGETLGESTFQKAIPLLDEVNELASYLADIIKKHAEPQWAVSGTEPSDLVKSGDNIWYLPGKEAKVMPVVAEVDIPGVLEFIREIRDQVHGALPELAFDELVKKDQIATATLELQLMELVLKVKRTRPNYDHALADAMRMAGRAAKSLRVGEVSLLDDEGLRFDSERPVLPLDLETKIRIRLQELALEREEAMQIDEGQQREPATRKGSAERDPDDEPVNEDEGDA